METENAQHKSTGSFEKGLGGVQNGWFTEFGTLWPGQGLSLKINKVLFKAKSAFQDVAVVETASHGNALILDGVIQCTERDEFSYQEMGTHLVLNSIKEAPVCVLVVGGGDGGIIREVSRYSSVERIDIAEIDEMVVKVSKEFMPEMAVGFEDPRVNVKFCDGIEFVRNAKEATYDAIIVDSSDPVGPAEVLFEKPFFELMHKALKPGGAICTQAESLWLHLDIIRELASMCKEIFIGGSVSYGYTAVPTYPSGQIGFMICIKSDGNGPRDPRQPTRAPPAGGKTRLKYYNTAIHSACFVLPEFAATALTGFLTFQ